MFFEMQIELQTLWLIRVMRFSWAFVLTILLLMVGFFVKDNIARVAFHRLVTLFVFAWLGALSPVYQNKTKK